MVIVIGLAMGGGLSQPRNEYQSRQAASRTQAAGGQRVSRERETMIRELVAGYKKTERGEYDDALAVAYQLLKTSKENGDDLLELAALKLVSDIHLQIGDKYIGTKMTLEALLKQLDLLKSWGIRRHYSEGVGLLIDILNVDETYIFYAMASDPVMGSFVKSGEELQTTLSQALESDLPEDKKSLIRQLKKAYDVFFKKFNNAIAEKNVRDLEDSSIKLMDFMDRSTESILKYAPKDDPEIVEMTRSVLRAYSKYMRAFWARDKQTAAAAMWGTLEPLNNLMKKDDGITIDEAMQRGLTEQVAKLREELDQGGDEVFREIFSAGSPKGIFNVNLLHFMKADPSIEAVLKRYGYVTISDLEPYREDILKAVDQIKEAVKVHEESENDNLPTALPPSRFSIFDNAIAINSAFTADGKWLYTGNPNALRTAEMEYSRLLDEVTSHRKLAQYNLDVSRSYLLLKRAVISYDLGDLPKASSYLQEVLNLSQKRLDSELIWQTYFFMGLLHKREGNMSQAIDSFKSAARTIEGLRSSFRTENIRTVVLDDKIFVYEFLIDILNKTNNQAEALAYVEKTKARILLDRFLDARMRITPSMATPAFSRIQNSAQKIHELQLVKTGSGAEYDDSELNKLNEGIRGETERYDAATEELRYSRPEFGSIITGETLTVEEIQKLIDENTVVLEYFTGADKIFIFVVGKQGPVNAATVAIDNTEFEKAIHEFRDCIETENCDHRQLARQVYGILIAPVESLIKDKRLCIIPHGLSHFLPFQVLMKGDRYLVQDHQIFYSPSSSVLKYAFSKRSQAKHRICVVANPGGNLLSAEEEAQQVAKLFPESTVFLRSQATKENIITSISNADILHFATHANLDKENPLSSELLLANGTSLRVADIYGLELKASLVTLSACETHLGRLTSGDEVIGLTRAFMFAGAPSIVTSLWQVRSDSTTKLMVSFYQKLTKAGTSKVEALRQAQLEMAQSSGRYSHPCNWAAFVLVGDFQ